MRLLGLQSEIERLSRHEPVLAATIAAQHAEVMEMAARCFQPGNRTPAPL